MNHFELEYRDMVDHVILTGEERPSRVGNTRQRFGGQLAIHSLIEGRFPILTGRTMYPRSIFGELAAFLTGSTDLKTFKDFGCNYWDANAAEWGPNAHEKPENYSVGRIYGAQWRHWTKGYGYVDQIQKLIEGLKSNPYGRRHLLTTYNPGELDEMCLPPCHLLAQFNYNKTHHRVDVHVYMRSVDLCLGLPSDIILYSSLLLLVAQEVGMNPGLVGFSFGDMHVYENHLEKWKEYMGNVIHPLPHYELDQLASVNDFHPDHLNLVGYNHGPIVKFPLNV